MVYKETFNLLLMSSRSKILSEQFDLRLSIAAFTDFGVQKTSLDVSWATVAVV